MSVMDRPLSALWTLAALAAFAMPAYAVDGTDGADKSGDGSTPLVSDGGPGSDAPGTPGDGGDGGTVTVVTTAPIVGDISVSAHGGTGGNDASQTVSGGTGGDGGIVNITVDHDVSGGISVNAAGALGGYGLDNNGNPLAPGGSGKSITITIDAHVGTFQSPAPAYSIDANVDAGPYGASNGVVHVILEAGAVLDGPIIGSHLGGNGNSSITFRLELQDQTALAQAKADLAAHVNDMVVINGHTYSWVAFGQIIDELRLAGVTNVVVVLGGGGSSGSSASTTANPHYLACRPGGVIAYRDGASIVFNARNPDGGHFAVGTVTDGVFASANPLGWTVELDGGSAKVIDGNHELVATCTL